MLKDCTGIFCTTHSLDGMIDGVFSMLGLLFYCCKEVLQVERSAVRGEIGRLIDFVERESAFVPCYRLQIGLCLSAQV